MLVLSMHARTAIATERMTQFDMDSKNAGVCNDRQAVKAISGWLCWGASAEQHSGKGIQRLKDLECRNRHHAMELWGRSASVHTFDIVPKFLLSPQHWAQSWNIKKAKQSNCGEHTNNAKCVCLVLEWQCQWNAYPSRWTTSIPFRHHAGTNKNSRPSTVSPAWTTYFGSWGVTQWCHNWQRWIWPWCRMETLIPNRQQSPNRRHSRQIHWKTPQPK